MNELGKRIKLGRELAKLSQEELAQKLGVTKQSISAYETGHVDPKASQIQRIAEALGVSIAFLLDPDAQLDQLHGFASEEAEEYSKLHPGEVKGMKKEIEFLTEIKQRLTEQVEVQQKLIQAYEDGFVPKRMPKKNLIHSQAIA